MNAPADSQLAVSRQGHYAGPVTRLVAYALDQGIVTGIFTLSLALLGFAVDLVTGGEVSLSLPAAVLTVAYALWWLAYYAYPWAVSGKTLGMAIVGIRVVSEDGDDLGPKAAILRAITLPLGFLTLGLGFLWALVDVRRRALHDRLAHSAVVYDWDARAARLRFLARRTAERSGPADHAA
ncbi:MAG: RDD family protein [Microthrixaceae bacterium]